MCVSVCVCGMARIEKSYYHCSKVVMMVVITQSLLSFYLIDIDRAEMEKIKILVSEKNVDTCGLYFVTTTKTRKHTCLNDSFAPTHLLEN